MFSLNEVLPTADDLRKLFDVQKEWVQQRLADGDQDHLFPYLAVLVQGPEGQGVQLCCLAVDFNSDHAKRSAIRQLGRKIYEDRVIPLCIVLSAEAWLAKNPPPGIQPKDFAGREEVLILMGQTICRKHTLHASASVTRLRDKIHAGEFSDTTGDFAAPLLRHFWDGFFEQIVAKKAGAN